MSSFLPSLYKVYDLVYDSVYGFEKNYSYIALNYSNFSNQKTMSRPNYSLPKIYTGGINIADWKLLSKQEQLDSLKKDWYIYYSFRCPTSGLLKRQTPIKGHANSYKTKTERLQYLVVLKESLEICLKNGISPYIDNDFSFLDSNENKKGALPQPEAKVEVVEKITIQKTDEISIQSAFEKVLLLKQNVMNKTSYGNYKLRINKFLNSLPDTSLPISSIEKKDVLVFLNEILLNTSPRNRNNYRTDLNSFFNELENNEYIPFNFVSKIKVLKSIPERNKTYSDAKQLDIYNYLEEKDKQLLLFIKFISYNFLRPVEVCRLKIKDIDIKERKLYVRAKNKPVKIKIIPEILIVELPNLTELNPESYLFTPNGYGITWVAEENNRRDYFSKRFNEVVKKKFNLNKDYGLYSFRHTFITRLYRKIRESKSQQVAKSDLMLITGHSTIIALEKYLRDIDAELPSDYSKLLE